MCEVTEKLNLMGEHAFENYHDELVITADKYEYGKLSCIITWLLLGRIFSLLLFC